MNRQSINTAARWTKERVIPDLRSIRLVPLSEISFPEDGVSLSFDKLLFCLRSAIGALSSYEAGRYVDFDALTTTTCCHGLSIYLRCILVDISRYDVKKMLEDLRKQEILALEKQRIADSLLPEELIRLVQLYILCFIKEKDLETGWITNKKKIKEISSIPTRFGERLIKKIQKYFSNLIAERYSVYADILRSESDASKGMVSLWSKYVQPEYIRVDTGGRKYTSNLFSMQVALRYLSHSRARIALVNDIKSLTGIRKAYHVHFLEGNGTNLVPCDISPESHGSNPVEPIVVFGGCSYSDDLHPKFVEFRLGPWLQKFQSLVLACDTFYPQFPKVRGDSAFNSAPIVPSEPSLIEEIEKYSNISGVSATDSSLFCLSHIYVASLKEVLEAKYVKNTNLLPEAFIPRKIRDI